MAQPPLEKIGPYAYGNTEVPGSDTSPTLLSPTAGGISSSDKWTNFHTPAVDAVNGHCNAP